MPALLAASRITCVRASDETLCCWGRNANGQLDGGLGTFVAVPTQLPARTGVDRIAIGHEHSCALVDGAVTCWGTPNQAKDVGQANAPALADAVQVSAGDTHCCAVRETGETVCWGDIATGP